ncbi:MAG: 30S ribosomal protein S4 [Clostridiales bacterium]|nr:30S ribosomal protein S4 [Clostridia bacterium]MCR4747294.1 30S ribosomal protein S4 [Clostridiales bacterium]
MSRYTGAVCKQCRREGKKLFLKGDRCYTGKCALERRSYAPGQHGQGRKKTSEYGTQLRTKQQARRYYGVQESQFHKYFLMAEKMEGMTGENLLKLCESRLDNVVYLLGWANSRQQARQLVTHGHFKVNGRKCDIPSYLLKAGDTISIKEKSVDTNGFKVILETNGSRTVPTWLSKDNTTAKVVNLPDREQIAAPVEEHYIVEFYSK